MPYVCVDCHVFWPCTVAEHDAAWSLRMLMPVGTQFSIPCWVMDHSECTVPMFCKCPCHQQSELEEPAIALPPSNR